jgi:hypothetical protein
MVKEKSCGKKIKHIFDKSINCPSAKHKGIPWEWRYGATHF